MATFHCKRCDAYGVALSVEGPLIMEPEACPACGANKPLDLEKKDPLAGTPIWEYDQLEEKWIAPASAQR